MQVMFYKIIIELSVLFEVSLGNQSQITGSVPFKSGRAPQINGIKLLRSGYQLLIIASVLLRSVQLPQISNSALLMKG